MKFYKIVANFILSKPFWSHPKFVEEYNFLQKSQWWTKNELQNYQMERLRQLLEYAFENVPYYNRIFKERHLTPRDIRNYEDLGKLPILTKDIIRNNYKELISPKAKKGDFIESSTSGSTGAPLHFLLDKDSNHRENAFMARAWSYGGYKIGDLVINLRSYAPKKGEPLFYFDSAHKNKFLYLSAYNLSDNVMYDYVQIIQKYIKKYGDCIIRGYPSSLYIFSLFLQKHNILLEGIKGVITSSETLLPIYRQVIEKAFRKKVLDWYGCNERVVTIQQCGENEGYHTNAEYGILEIVDEEGRQLKSGGGYIIGTGLHNYVMPLIRYHTGDIGEISENKICSCGRGLPLDLIKIEGRTDEILNFFGKNIPPVNFYTMFHEIPNIIQFQLIQNSFDTLLVRLVVNNKYSNNDNNKLRKALLERVGDKVHIDIKITNQIERDLKTGKIRCIINLYK